jgi:hypothetical protein
MAGSAGDPCEQKSMTERPDDMIPGATDPSGDGDHEDARDGEDLRPGWQRPDAARGTAGRGALPLLCKPSRESPGNVTEAELLSRMQARSSAPPREHQQDGENQDDKRCLSPQ